MPRQKNNCEPSPLFPISKLLNVRAKERGIERTVRLSQLLCDQEYFQPQIYVYVYCLSTWIPMTCHRKRKSHHHSVKHKFARSAEPAKALYAASAPCRIMASPLKIGKKKPLASRVRFAMTTTDPQLHFSNWNFNYQWHVFANSFVQHVRYLTNICHKKDFLHIKAKSLKVMPSLAQVK